MIRYLCPRCRKSLVAQDGAAGAKLNCPDCGQRLQIPVPPPPVNKTVLGTLEEQPNRTVLGKLESPAEPGTPVPTAQAGAVPPVPRTILVETPVPPDAMDDLEEVEDARPRRRRSREHDEDDDRPPRRRRVRPCPQCGCTDYPWQTTKFGSASIALVILGILFWPLIIVAFLVQEKWEVCAECGEKLRQTGTGF
jgi:hypothetical protein